MPDRWTQSLIPTSREAPAEAEAPSHQLMLRAGLIRKLGSGVYTYLPLGLRALHKAMRIVREEMNRADAVEILMPTLQPIDLWERTGRRTDYGDNLFVVKDRHGREQALGPTHEEVITELVGAYVESYRQLPLCLYQIQTKFRDEFRPRFGVLRSREFQMKDAYSFHLTVDRPGGLDETYQAQYQAYCRIFDRAGVPYEIVEAEAGPIGGDASHEFMIPADTGEDVILKSDRGNYAANVEKCGIGMRAVVSGAFAPVLTEREAGVCATVDAANPTGELEDVHTPGCGGIEDVCTFFKKQLKSTLKPGNMLKTLVCRRTGPDADGSIILAVVRGDHELNEAKLRAACGADVELADEAFNREQGLPIGYVGPQLAAHRGDVTLVIDPDAAVDQFWVTGANEVDHHVRHFHWKRDVLEPLGEAAKDRVRIADIRNALAGDPSPRNDGGVLSETRGIEVGHVFKLGTKYSEKLDAFVLDEANQRRPIIMGCYGIGVNRILAGAIERAGGHDAKGVIWPVSLAPYAVVITPIKYDGAVRDAALRLAGEIEAAGFDVLIDDREERPGVKFNDADLIGLPVRITVGDKGLAQGEVELKARDGRTGEKGEAVKLDAAVNRVIELLKDPAARA